MNGRLSLKKSKQKREKKGSKTIKFFIPIPASNPMTTKAVHGKLNEQLIPNMWFFNYPNYKHN